MDVKKTISTFKKAADETINGLNYGIGYGSSLSDMKKVIEAQKKGVVTAKKIIYKIYKLSDENNINSSKWIIDRIKKLTEASTTILDKLSSPLMMSYEEIGVKDESNADKYYENKNNAADAWIDITSSVEDLEKLVENTDVNGNIVIEDDDEDKASFCEIHAKLEMKMGTKAGYNPEIDAVVIDPNGSIGEIRDVYGLRIALPKLPPKNKILNKGKKRENQYWIRESKPKGLTINTVDKFQSFINEEFRRKREGIWFYNDGMPEYITGAHWFLLQHGRTDADGNDIHEHGYFHFRSAHRDIFYFMEAVWVDKRSLGLIYEKTRRTGATYCMIDFGLAKAVTSMDANFGLTSKTGNDAEDIFNIMIVRMFEGLPFYFKPNRTTDSPKSAYEFKQASSRIGRKDKEKDRKSVSLNTTISYKNTTNDAYDQFALKLYIGDEFSKWKKPGDILSHWRMISRAMTKGSRHTGKAFLLSTIENVKGYDDPTDSQAGMGDKFKYLYKNSNLDERDAYGRTKTKLYKLFIPCYDNFEGFIDVYGYPVKNTPKEPVMGVDGELITSGILEFLQAEANTKNTQDEKYNFWRLNPRTEDEGFRVAVEDSNFDVKRIDSQLSFNESKDPSELYVRGNFKFKGGVIPDNPQQAQVEFHLDETNGRFLVSWMPKPADRNAKIIRNGIVKPLNTDMGTFGSDPFRVNQTVNRSGSNGSIHGVTSFNNINAPQGKFFLEYLHRPSTTDDFAWDIIKVCVFYGMKILIESNVRDALVLMYNFGYTGYSMRRPDKPKAKYTEEEKKYGGIPASTGNIDSLSNIIAWYIDNYVGGESNDAITKMPFNRTLQDWMKFKKENRTKHDATVSSSLAIFANRYDAHINNEKGNKNGKHVSAKVAKMLTHKGM